MMLVLLLFLEKVAGDHTLTGPSEVKPCAGRSVQIVCRYHPFYSENVKYWCKGYYFNHCTVLVQTSQSQDVYEDLQIRDDKRGRFFTVSMKSTETADSGWYWCAIERVSRHIRKAVQLIVSAEEAQNCSVPPEPPQNIIEVATRPLPTSASMTFRATSIIPTSHATMPETTDSPEIILLTSHGEIYIERFAHKLWSITRWILFVGMCLYLSCFITCVKIWFRRS